MIRTARRVRSSLALPLAALLLLVLGTIPAQAAPMRQPARDKGSITVFAAASLKEAFTSIGDSFSRANDVTVRFNFGGSDTLATQIVQGAPADVFASANQTQLNVVGDRGLLAGIATVFARNRLVLIVPKNNPRNIVSLVDLGRTGVNLVLAAPTVPVGKYERAAFAVMATDAAFGPDFLSRIRANTRSEELDVKAVAAKVTLGEADAGIVYVTDVTPQVAGKVQTIAIPAPFNQVAQYPIAVTKNAGNAALARRFVDYVQSSGGKAVLRDRGFIIGSPAASYATSFQVSGLVATPISFTADDLRKLPATTVTVTLRTRTGKSSVASYTGPLLTTVLAKAGLVLNNASFKNDNLRQFVTVAGSDNYQATLSLAELQPDFGNVRAILAYAKDTQPLGQDEGAVRLIVPGDHLAGRWVGDVTQVVVGTPLGTP